MHFCNSCCDCLCQPSQLFFVKLIRRRVLYQFFILTFSLLLSQIIHSQLSSPAFSPKFFHLTLKFFQISLTSPPKFSYRTNLLNHTCFRLCFRLSAVISIASISVEFSFRRHSTPSISTALLLRRLLHHGSELLTNTSCTSRHFVSSGNEDLLTGFKAWTKSSHERSTWLIFYSRYSTSQICGSIWSCSSEGVLSFSAFSVFSFCHNHHILLLFGRSQWLT